MAQRDGKPGRQTRPKSFRKAAFQIQEPGVRLCPKLYWPPGDFNKADKQGADRVDERDMEVLGSFCECSGFSGLL